ncbi:hypothetical protein [Goodfellowiella coeruleoviolacea]|uniref:Uncharacterized protein n=1 Tax=Goodfellowiella coeruleoviolacea TaxID=334858 RepID=A0AAE3GE16_9PSEU|nr:hypothetical protein [Goodfellowiella coeruleoviolacea]MCP2166023.1 hypothetical protein [Goodfellowiella coeruleoviolacea]
MINDEDLQAGVDRAGQLLARGRVGEAGELLLAAAEHGHAGAASTLGRLGCLDWTWPPGAEIGEDDVCAAEPWLRRALELRPDDAVAARLLASLLLRQVATVRAAGPWALPGAGDVAAGADDPEEAWQALLDRRQAEAVRLLDEVVSRNPTDVAAAVLLADAHHSELTWHLGEQPRERPPLDDADTTGRDVLARLTAAARRAAHLDPADAAAVFHLAEALHWGEHAEAAAWRHRLGVLRPEAQDATHQARPGERPGQEAGAAAELPTHGRYSWYVLEFGRMVDNTGDNCFDVVLSSDLGELRWVLDRWLSRATRSRARRYSR